jgi:hypothetical protein
MADSITVAFLILAGVAATWTHIILFCSYLKRAHHAVWVRLGEPSLSNWSTRSSLLVWRFMWLDHAKVDSLPLRVYVVSGQVLQVLILALLFVLAVAYGRAEAS